MSRSRASHETQMKLYTIKLEPSVSVGCEHWVPMPKVPPCSLSPGVDGPAGLLFCLLFCL